MSVLGWYPMAWHTSRMDSPLKLDSPLGWIHPLCLGVMPACIALLLLLDAHALLQWIPQDVPSLMQPCT